MRKSIITATVLLVCAISCIAQTKGFVQETERKGDKLYVIENGEHFIVYTKTVVVKPLVQLEKIAKQYHITAVHKLGFIEVSVPEGSNIEEFKKELIGTGYFESVEYITEVKFCGIMSTTSGYYADWYWNILHAQGAWAITRGSSNIKVAVIDTGIDRSHQDIGYGTGSNAYTNISYTLGYNYVHDTQYTTPVHSHGTHMAGLIGAKANNSIGIDGISGGNHSPGVTLISYCMTDTQDGPYIGIPDAIVDAVDNGVKVINMSFSTSSSFYMETAINYAYNNNVSIVCASGNNNTSSLSYPANNSKTIAVGGVNSSLKRWESLVYPSKGSNYGSGLDIVAIGGPVETTELGGGYSIIEGTSGAAALVSGSVALMLSENSSLSPSEILTILRSTATKIHDHGYTYNSVGWNLEVGYGVLNVCSAVLKARKPVLAGPDVICSSSTGTYYISNLPSCATVNWSLINTNIGITLPMQISGYSCTITNNSTASFSGTLKAEVQVNGVTELTFTKTINISGTFSGYYSSGIYSGNFTLGTPLIVTKNIVTYIESTNFRNKSLSWDYRYVHPSSWSYDGDQVLSLTYPSDGSGPLVIEATALPGQPDCDNFQITLCPSSAGLNMAISQDNEMAIINLNLDAVLLKTGGSVCSDERISTEWTVHIYDVLTGKEMYRNQLSEQNCVINTKEWKSGVYVAYISVGKKVLTEKFVVK